MKLVGLVGWRGMVGSVLMQRMQEEGDFAYIEPVFFSTSNAGGTAPAMAKNETTLKDANDLDALKKCDIIVTCQGGDYIPKFSRNCVQPVGMATGLMQHRPCGCRTMPLLFSIQSIWVSSELRSMTA